MPRFCFNTYNIIYNANLKIIRHKDVYCLFETNAHFKIYKLIVWKISPFFGYKIPKYIRNSNRKGAINFIID